jgi:hypothetical protein
VLTRYLRPSTVIDWTSSAISGLPVAPPDDMCPIISCALRYTQVNPAFPHPRLVPLCLLFRNPEFGHELGTKSAEDDVASGGSGVVIAAIAGVGSFHRMSMIVRATPPTRSRAPPVANVRGDPNNTNSPNTRSHTGTIAVRLNSINMVDFLSWCGLRTMRSQAAVAVPYRTNRRVDVSPGAKEAGSLDPASLR